MIETTAIRNTNNESFSVVWDTGRRCNYDCSYCESSRHNNTSNFKSLDEFKNTFNFIQSWTNLYNSKRKNPTHTNINFTGGEPTANPNFWKLLDHIKSQPEPYYLGLTTNGAWGTNYSKKILTMIDHVTISYHAEADPKLKERSILNILTLAETDINLQVNVMLHMDHWEETLGVYNSLKKQGISARPRPIGDGAITRKGWFIDADGTNRRTSHEYTEEQQSWFWNEMGLKGEPKSLAEGNQLGRACCGSRCIEAKVDDVWQPVKLISTNFEKWNCLVDWYFLYVDQETDLVYHHQTCQALYNGQRGPIGSLKDSTRLIEDLKQRLEDKDKFIVCPNKRCGCGMCVPKSRDLEDFIEIKKSILA
jgi:MoaA/NifB/PqqE/SkfB family radical SAM enzyme